MAWPSQATSSRITTSRSPACWPRSPASPRSRSRSCSTPPPCRGGAVAADLTTRTTSFGQDYALSPVDKFGTWLSARSLRRHVGDWKAKRVADIGCGHDARITTPLLDEVAHLTV